MRTGMKKNPKLMKQTSKFGYPNDRGSSQAQRVLFLVTASIQINGCFSHGCTLRNTKHQVGSDCMAYHTKHLLQHQKSDRRIPCVMGEQLHCLQPMCQWQNSGKPLRGSGSRCRDILTPYRKNSRMINKAESRGFLAAVFLKQTRRFYCNCFQYYSCIRIPHSSLYGGQWNYVARAWYAAFVWQAP